MKTTISHPQIVKKFNKKMILISAVIATAGIVAMFLSWTLAGSFLLIISLIIYFVKSTQEVYSPSGSYVKTTSCYFDKDRLTALKGIIEKPVTEETPLFKLMPQGSGRIDLVYSADKEFAGVQLYQFIPHTYEPASDMVSYTGNDARKLLKYIEKCRA
jgi:hypothetical protein